MDEPVVYKRCARLVARSNGRLRYRGSAVNDRRLHRAAALNLRCRGQRPEATRE